MKCLPGVAGDQVGRGSVSQPTLEDMNYGSAAQQMPAESLGKILVVDDNADNVEIIATRLRFRGYEILEATNGQEALDCVKRDAPDLILLDVMLPDIDGYEISRRIKSDSELPFIPIILVTARDATGKVNATIKNNNVATPLGGVRPGIRVDAGNGISTDDAVCLDISGNTSAGSGGSQGIGLRKQGTVTTTNDFGVEGMAATGTPGVESFVSGQNPAGNGTLLISATSGFSNCNTAP